MLETHLLLDQDIPERGPIFLYFEHNHIINHWTTNEL